MADLMVLELHFPSNWAHEGTVEVLYVDGENERSYGTLAQGAYMTRETYPGHRWNVRESVSRELLMSIVAAPPAPHIVKIGADGGRDPVKAAVWRMGQAPREPLLAAVRPCVCAGCCAPALCTGTASSVRDLYKLKTLSQHSSQSVFNHYIRT